MLIGLSGPARVGKDTVAGILVENYGFRRVGLADKMREALYALNPYITPQTSDPDLEHYFDAFPAGTWPLQDVVDKVGWDAAKQLPEVRRLLQRFGTEAGREIHGENVWIDAAMNGLLVTDDIVISDVRFENEAAYVRENYGHVVHLSRPGIGPVNGHQSDQGIEIGLNDWNMNNVAGKEGWLDLVGILMKAIKQAIDPQWTVIDQSSKRPMSSAYFRHYLDP